jgi:hypothetical protein
MTPAPQGGCHCNIRGQREAGAQASMDGEAAEDTPRVADSGVATSTEEQATVVYTVVVLGIVINLV